MHVPRAAQNKVMWLMMFLLIAGGLDQMVPLEPPSDPNNSLKMQARI